MLLLIEDVVVKVGVDVEMPPMISVVTFWKGPKAVVDVVRELGEVVVAEEITVVVVLLPGPGYARLVVEEDIVEPTDGAIECPSILLVVEEIAEMLLAPP